MSVADNIAFPLEVRGIGRRDRASGQTNFWT